MCISREEWTQMWEWQWRSTSSKSWREFGWKTLIRFFITPCQKAHYDGNPPVCWRNCGYQGAHHTHIMWDCPVLRTYWKDIHGILQGIFNCTFPQDMKTIFFGCIPQNWSKNDICLLRALLVASKKCITKKWSSQDIPTLSLWWEITLEIYRMEEVTAHVNDRMAWFHLCWDKWVQYVNTYKPNFLFKA